MDGIEQILDNKMLLIHLQPILSLEGRALFGLEALVRGIGPEQEVIPPAWLFSEAAKAGLSAELDRQARHLSIHAFAPLWRANPKLLLFVNFESTLIDNFKLGDYLFDGILRSLGIPYSNIVLEIKEDDVRNTSKLQYFCNHYRSLGFNIALDDFGIGQSSFDRLAIVRPDIIKIDRSLIADIHNNYIHQEIVQTICKMSANLGAIALAEGAETLEEAIYSKYLGATLIQGFWFAKPSIDPTVTDFNVKLDQVKSGYHQRMLSMHQQHEHLRDEAEYVCREVHAAIMQLPQLSEWTLNIGDMLDNYPDIEALYLINGDAKQIGPTLMRCNTRAFYEPTPHGYDHSFRDYYTRTKESLNGFHLTSNYVSLASGNICCTYARNIDIRGEIFVLCIDFMR
jgi:EAL domain-containing protein (putative c-di-GMP-specific phosphodiesterase class I)